MLGGMDYSIFPVQHHSRRQKRFGLAVRHHVLENLDLFRRELVAFEGLSPASDAFLVCGIAHDDSIPLLIKFVRHCCLFRGCVILLPKKAMTNGRSEDSSAGARGETQCSGQPGEIDRRRHATAVRARLRAAGCRELENAEVLKNSIIRLPKRSSFFGRQAAGGSGSTMAGAPNAERIFPKSG
jgi:hypothetical protein